MEMKIYWTDFAKVEVKLIYVFLKRGANIAVAKKITKEITDEVKLLINQPYLGQIEQQLIGASREFRSLIYNNYKVIYWINLDKNQIEIWDVFDCRHELLKIKRTK
ncbi:MAG: type II toxin-antitoxin system RelE/ParE family toxin [Flavobacterium sp.]|nr:type II toxin-antitoxin system RelE/ParE family toxin [Flavobacterium sp.]